MKKSVYNLVDEPLLPKNLGNEQAGLQLLDQPREKGFGECFCYTGQKILGATVHYAGARHGNVYHHSLCGSASYTLDKIRKGTVSTDNMGLNLDGVLLGILLHIKPEISVKLPKHSTLCWPITSEMMELCLSWRRYKNLTNIKRQSQKYIFSNFFL